MARIPAEQAVTRSMSVAVSEAVNACRGLSPAWPVPLLAGRSKRPRETSSHRGSSALGDRCLVNADDACAFSS